MKKNKILIVSHLYPSPGKATKGIFVHKQSLALRRLGFGVEIISPQVIFKDIAPKKYDIDGIKVWAPKYFSFGKKYASLTGLTGYLGAKKLMKNLAKPDIILAHTALPDGGIAQIISRKMSIPYFVYVHGADVQHKINYNSSTRGEIMNILSGAKNVLVNSSKTQRLVSGLGIDSVITPMGVDEIKVKNKTKNTKTVSLISVCNLGEEKGIQYAIEAVKEIDNPKIEYSIIGDGSYKSKLQELAVGDKRIKFLGRLEQEKVFENLAKSDIFVLPSYNEAFGVAYLEAMSFGLPIIGIKGEGVEDIVSKGECGILVERKSAQAVQGALEKLIQDEVSRERMGNAGRKIVIENYLWDKVVVELKKELVK